MSKADASITIGPEAYVSWRAAPLRSITEKIDQRLLFDMIGDLTGRRVLDAGCGDGTLVCAAASRGAEARFRTAAELRALAEQAGLSIVAIRGAVYYPPIGLLARALAPIDSWFGGLTTFGAAFIVLGAVSPDRHREG